MARANPRTMDRSYPHDRNPEDPYHRVDQRGSTWYCTKCGAEFGDNEQSAEEHEASRGGES